MPIADTAPDAAPDRPVAGFALPTRWRQSLFYALLYAGTGASLPFIPLWFSHHGVSASQISLILAIPLLGRAITGPLSGVWADRFARYRSPMLIMALAGAFAYILMGLSRLYLPWRFPVFLALYFIGYTALTNIGPLLDAMTLQLSRMERFSYALARAAGSAAFIFANVVLGYLLQTTGNTNFVLAWIVGAALCVGIVGRVLLAPQPRLEVRPPGQARGSGLTRFMTLMSDEGLLWLLFAVSCLQAAHAFYYAFSTIIWRARGFSAETCGLLWACAVVGEISFLTLTATWRRRIGPWRLLLIGAAVGVVRWALMALSPPLWLMWPLQLTHGFSFAAVYLAALDLVFCLTPKGYEGLAQTINSAYSQGVMTGVATIVSGPIFEHFGPHGYGFMLALALVGFMAATWLFVQRHRLVAARAAVAEKAAA
jgi:PPP family 3-phenylpropionic acid transporter